MTVVEAGRPLLIRVSGRDRPSLTRDLLQLLGGAGAVLEDMEQLVVRERLTLDVLVRLDGADSDWRAWCATSCSGASRTG